MHPMVPNAGRFAGLHWVARLKMTTTRDQLDCDIEVFHTVDFVLVPG